MAQSMGGVVAIRVALKNPERVRRIVLVASSGGVDVVGLGGREWRGDYRRDHPGAADWITRDRTDHTRELRQLTAPTLLLWGDSDPISPVAVGEHLRSLLPDARLHVVPGGTHSLAVERAAEAAAAVSAHLAGDADRGRSASPRAQGG